MGERELLFFLPLHFLSNSLYIIAIAFFCGQASKLCGCQSELELRTDFTVMHGYVRFVVVMIYKADFVVGGEKVCKTGRRLQVSR